MKLDCRIGVLKPSQKCKRFVVNRAIGTLYERTQRVIFQEHECVTVCSDSAMRIVVNVNDCRFEFGTPRFGHQPILREPTVGETVGSIPLVPFDARQVFPQRHRHAAGGFNDDQRVLAPLAENWNSDRKRMIALGLKIGGDLNTS